MLQARQCNIFFCVSTPKYLCSEHLALLATGKLSGIWSRVLSNLLFIFPLPMIECLLKQGAFVGGVLQLNDEIEDTDTTEDVVVTFDIILEAQDPD